MNTKSKIILCGLACAASFSAFAQPSNDLNIGYHTFSTSSTDANAFTVGYEMRFSDGFALSIRGLTFDYDYAEDFEFEEGEGIGAEVSAIFYPGGGNFFLAAGIGVGLTEWEYREEDQFGFQIDSDSGDSGDVEVFGRVGYKIELNGFHLTPQAQLGSWANTGVEFGSYFTIGIVAGAQF